MKTEKDLRNELAKEGMKELVVIFNNMTPGKKVKRFPTKAAGIDRIVGLHDFSDSVSVIKNIYSSEKKKAITLIQTNRFKSNSEFAKLDAFKHFCSKAGTKPTKRMASKFRNKKGLVFGAV